MVWTHVKKTEERISKKVLNIKVKGNAKEGEEDKTRNSRLGKMSQRQKNMGRN
jgi:hypothetical protein